MTATACLPDAAWLDAPPVGRALSLLDGDGEEARVVGGAARNALMGLPLSDIDIATTAVPQEIIRRAAAAGVKAVPTGIEHGTVTLVLDGQPFEVTTLRRDVETFGRKAKVAFGRDWKTDAERRDFTINALSISRDGVVHDYVGGLDDIGIRRVRFIGDPHLRIAEDYLRILRFFRFHAAYAAGPPDRVGLQACIAARRGLQRLSRERVRAELIKLLAAPFAAPTLAVMAEAGFLDRLLGGVPLLSSCTNMIEVEAAAGLPSDPLRRLGALGVLIAEDAERLWQRLRLFNTEHERLHAMAERWWRVAPEHGEAWARALLYRLGPVHYVDRVLLAWTRSPQGASDPAWHALATLPSRWAAPRFPLRAENLTSRGVPRGPALGAALRAAEDAWVASGFPQAKSALAALAETAAQRHRAPVLDHRAGGDEDGSQRDGAGAGVRTIKGPPSHS